MKNTKLPALLIAFLFLISSCSKEQPSGKKELVQIDLTNSQKSLVLSNNSFGFDVFRQISQSENSDRNIFISPLSISLSLAMTYNGADGETKTEMQNTLRFPDVTAEDINLYFQTLSNSLLNLDPTVKLGIANSIWYRQGFTVLPEFVTVNQTYFNAEVQALDFNSTTSVDKINNWVASETNDRITKVIDNISDDLVMFLINAIYFKGQWTYEFKKEATEDGPFHETPETQSTAAFMNQEGTFNYYSNDSLQMTEMPYGQGNFSMIVLLPKNGHSVSSLAGGLTPENWSDLTNNLQKANVAISMPRFKFEYERILNEDLTALGMGRAFSDFADFSRINGVGGLYISFVKHNSFVEVNEVGTEAAAVTVTGMATTSAGSEPSFIPFIADHPFVFVIRETTTNTILFMGRVSAL
jgi:serine protease inhibitor